jgi:hypothetical protein
MKKHIFYFAITAMTLFVSSSLIAQTHCDSLHNIVKDLLSVNIYDNSIYITDGQVYKSFLSESEISEVSATLFEGTTYRIATSAGIEENFMLFEVYDQDRNLLFSNTDYSNSPYWDFKVENTMDCTIETHLDLNKKLEGCALMMIAFKKAK